MSGWLITGDLHFSDKSEDSYRFGLFPWLVQKARELQIDSIIILGDITEKKDNHSSYLVNTICDGLVELTGYCRIYLLRGNHDAIDWKMPFFQFLDKIPNLHFFTDPDFRQVKLGRDQVDVLFLPTSRKPESEWPVFLESPKLREVEFIFTHQTFNGSVSESGYLLEGTSPDILNRFNIPIISGDIHRPQKVKNVEYVGSPYPVRFGDDFEHRLILVNAQREMTDIEYPCIKKLHLRISDAEELYEYGLSKGDQVKVSMVLDKCEFVHWDRYKNTVLSILKELGVENYGIQLIPLKRRDRRLSDRVRKGTKISNKEWYDKFCRKEGNTGLVYDIGLDLLKGK